MAENVRQQLRRGTIEVTYEGQVAAYHLPEWMQNCYGILDNEDELVAHLKHEGVLLGVLHEGIGGSGCLVGVRAKARPTKTKSDPNPSFPTANLKSKAYDFKPTLLPVEPEKKKEKDAMSALDAKSEEMFGKPKDQLDQDQKQKLAKEVGLA